MENIVSICSIYNIIVIAMYYMVSLLIRNIPDILHERLKQEAKKHRRSMMQEAIIILEESLSLYPGSFPAPIKGEKLISQEINTAAIQNGRH